jgi:hypothetical protein
LADVHSPRIETHKWVSTRDNCAEIKEETKGESKVSENLLCHSASRLQPPLKVDR